MEQKKETKMKIQTCNESEFGLTARIPFPSRRYFDMFLKLKCAPDLLKEKLFPNAKEITESLAAFWAVRKIVKPESFGKENYLLYDVCCGSTPRTAAIFAFLTRWQTFAIDPNLANRSYGIDRLQIFKQKLHEARIENPENKKIIITCVHPHIKFRSIMDAFANKFSDMLVIGIPCCVPFDRQEAQIDEFEDIGIWSPKRLVKIWKFSEKRD